MRVLFALAFLGACAWSFAATAGEQMARSLSGQLSITSEQGWPGKRYVEGGVVFAEEFDVNRDGRIDLWRFYRRDLLSSEEQDLNFDGRVDLVTTWNASDPRWQLLTGVRRDTRFRGHNDLEVENLGNNNRRWRIAEDRNGDGMADHILIAEGPYQFFEDLALNLELHPNLIDRVPMEYWVEYEADDGYCGFITDYRRYHRGRQTQYGEWSGRSVAWKRYDRRTPPAPAAPAATAGTPAFEPAPAAPGQALTAAPAPAPQPQFQGDTYIAPPETAPPAPSDPGAGFDQSTGYYYDDSLVQQPAATPPMSDRTRYQGLPPGESGARSLPARMRPPGVGRR